MDKLGHRLVEFWRDGVVDLDAVIQRARKQLVFHDRNAILFGNFSNLERDQILPLREDQRRGVFFFDVTKRDRIMRRIGDDESSPRHVRDHAATARQ